LYIHLANIFDCLDVIFNLDLLIIFLFSYRYTTTTFSIMHRLDTRQAALGRWRWTRPTGISSGGPCHFESCSFQKKGYSSRRPRSDTFLWAGATDTHMPPKEVERQCRDP
jgi:hypothetical protein